MNINRTWAMPSRDTFTCPPIGDFVKRYLRESKVSVDPFARNCQWATYTNDLNPDTAAQYHLPAEDFLALLIAKGVEADLIIFDPPYSMNQAKVTYQAIGIEKFTLKDAQSVGIWQREKDLADKLLVPGGYFLHFGWHTNGAGKKRGFGIEEILIVAHGRAHHDTLCMAERKKSHQFCFSGNEWEEK